MKWYLRHQYTMGPEAGTFDHVGPFDTEPDAYRHREAYGPIKSEAVSCFQPPAPCMSPEEHATYVVRRL